MNICKKDEAQEQQKFICGNLYTSSFCDIAIYNNYYNIMVALSGRKTYDNPQEASWIDVTDKYCLKEI